MSTPPPDATPPGVPRKWLRGCLIAVLVVVALAVLLFGMCAVMLMNADFR